MRVTGNATRCRDRASIPKPATCVCRQHALRRRKLVPTDNTAAPSRAAPSTDEIHDYDEEIEDNGIVASRRCRIARKRHRTRRSSGRDGAGHPKGRTRQIRPRTRHSRRNRPQDRRSAPAALSAGGRSGRKRIHANHAEGRAQNQIRRRSRRFHRRRSAADRSRPHRRRRPPSR